MMAPSAIKVEHLSKRYAVGQGPHRHDTFYDLLSHGLRHPLRALRSVGPGTDKEQFLALQNVSFKVQPGEVLGVIGRNGAGKSTLLKVLSRITAPSNGRVEIRGRLASLLEVGTGFHPELTGRENIFLNGAILGMSRGEILAKFDEIVAFAELDGFIDTPVKRYSSGMYVRLAFAVSAHLDVDVLIVDEVLAVGDAVFQERCLRKMENVSRGGRTVLFVSHNLGAVSRLCQRGIVLDKGELVFDGSADLAISQYTARSNTTAAVDNLQLMGDLGEKLSIERVSINDSTQCFGQVFFPDNEIRVAITGLARERIPELRVTVAIYKSGLHVLSLHDLREPRDLCVGQFQSTIAIPALHLSPGEYSLELGAYSLKGRHWLWATRVAAFAVASKWFPDFDIGTEMGLVNLPIWGNRTDKPDELTAGDCTRLPKRSVR
jgi:lipopolysaccharide transport system ATP-binding protein